MSINFQERAHDFPRHHLKALAFASASAKSSRLDAMLEKLKAVPGLGMCSYVPGSKLPFKNSLQSRMTSFVMRTNPNAARLVAGNTGVALVTPLTTTQ